MLRSSRKLSGPLAPPRPASTSLSSFGYLFGPLQPQQIRLSSIDTSFHQFVRPLLNRWSLRGLLHVSPWLLVFLKIPFISIYQSAFKTRDA